MGIQLHLYSDNPKWNPAKQQTVLVFINSAQDAVSFWMNTFFF